ncbi:hypothetical protein Ahy_A06g026019 [Arachis hypogaea]|uniref:Retrotransposon gag domain-containing protein n=1 Tax=Arachis hypogaea TaxID=3818 RepID=A0A445CJ59_ARAHY|nr:hypothetical protein Ahy_A06g026019 [Arachis hypogaea]
MLLALETFDLDSLIHQDRIPPTHITPALTTEKPSPTLVPNPAHATWKKQDKLVLLWLHSHISENVLAYVIACETSRSTWIALENLFDAQSSVRADYLKTSLQDLQKGSLTMIDYIAQKRKLANSIAKCGYIVQEQDLKNFIFKGLDSSYNNF